MRVAMIVDGVTTYPPYCPFAVTNSHHSTICGHPAMDAGRKSLYCDYIDDAGRYVNAPPRCPLIRGSKDVVVRAEI